MDHEDVMDTYGEKSMHQKKTIKYTEAADDEIFSYISYDNVFAAEKLPNQATVVSDIDLCIDYTGPSKGEMVEIFKRKGRLV